MLHTIRMGVAELVIPDNEEPAQLRVRHLRESHRRDSQGAAAVSGTVNATIRNVFRAITPPPSSAPNDDQKNWSPFLFNGSIHFIQRVHPLHIVSVRHYDDDPYNDLYSVSVSQTDYSSVWRYGELRGGTNALLVPSGGRPWASSSSFPTSHVYLTLFHSNTILPGNILRTYFMGALVFSALPPFTVLAMTEFPLVDNSLYDGG